jgi:hypothetical protein
MAAFCREENIKLAQFYRWCRRFRHEDSDRSGGFVKLVAVSGQAHSGATIFDTTGFIIEWASGESRRVVLPSSVMPSNFLSLARRLLMAPNVKQPIMCQRLHELLETLLFTAVVSVVLCVAVLTGVVSAEDELPISPNYPYKYEPPEIQTQNLTWNELAGDTLTFEFPQHQNAADPRPKYDIRYGELWKTNKNIVIKTGTRSDLVRIPTDGSLTHIRQDFSLSVPELNWSNDPYESGPSYSCYCEDDQCPEYVEQCISCGGAYNPGFWNSGYWTHSLRFDINNPDSYQLPFDWLTVDFSVSKPVKEGPGQIIAYEASVPVEVSISLEFRQWQVNQILAKRLRPPTLGKTYMRVDVVPRFGFTPKETALIGRYPGSDPWITYDHFNWIQILVERGKMDVNTKQVLETVQVPPNCYDPPLHTYPAGTNVFTTDGFPMYFDEWSNSPPPGAMAANSVRNPTFKGGLLIQDAPNLVYRGEYAKYETHLVGVIVDPATHQTVGYEDLSEVFSEQADQFIFHWTFLQTDKDTDAPDACQRTIPPSCGELIFNTDLSLGGKGVATVYWQGATPPPDVELFPSLVTVDIDPGSTENQIIFSGEDAQVSVAILTTPESNALNIDPQTVRFGPSDAVDTDNQAEVLDVDGDGDDDLLFNFYVKDTGIQCSMTTSSITGQTYAGELIAGLDSIETVDCVEPPIYDYDGDKDVDGKDLASFIESYSETYLPGVTNEFGVALGN